MSAGALERVIRAAKRRQAAQGCDLCGEPLPGEHRHLLDIGGDAALCACLPCFLLFDREAAGGGHYRQIPRRRRRLPVVATAALGVPVGLAFFVAGDDGTVRAHYPSPAGPARWEVGAGAWRDVLGRHRFLRDLAPEVEALLVNTARGRNDHWLVPIDDCFRLVALVRREWRGLSGGGAVWAEIERFFGELTERQ